MAREKADQDGSGKLQIVCARKVDWYAETPTPTDEEKRAEKESIRQILLSLEEGSCAIPSWEFKRVKILTGCCTYMSDWYDLFSFFMGNGGVDKADEISVSVPPPPPIRKPENEEYDSIKYHTIGYNNTFKYTSIQRFIRCIAPGDTRSQRFIRCLPPGDVLETDEDEDVSDGDGDGHDEHENEDYDSIKYHTIPYNNTFKDTSIRRFIQCIGPGDDPPLDVVEADEDEDADVSETDGDGDVNETDGDDEDVSDGDGDGDGHDEQTNNLWGADEQSQSQCVGGENKTTKFIRVLKANGIHHLLTHNATKEMIVDDLQEKVIGLVVCDFKMFLMYTNLQQIYEDLQKKDSNFIWIWIPTKWPEDCGYDSYTRLIQCMPWATFLYPQLVKVKGNPFLPFIVILDKEGQITNRDALPLLLAWGVEAYPFTQHTIPESFSLVESMSCLEFLLHGMNIVRKSKMTFVYAEDPRRRLKTKSKLEELTQIPGSFEVLYVGKFHEMDYIDYYDEGHSDDLEILKNHYENKKQNMRWPSLSFSDMISFWYRCMYLMKKSNMETLHGRGGSNMETLHVLATDLYRVDLYSHHGLYNWGRLVLMDDGGLVTSGGYHVVQMICESSSESSNEEEEEEEEEELEVLQVICESLEFEEVQPQIFCLSSEEEEEEEGEGEGMAIRRVVKKELIESLGRGKCESSGEQGEGDAITGMVKKELIESLGRGECSAIVRTFFRDVIDNHPQHPQHPLSVHSSWDYLSEWKYFVMCGVCGVDFNFDSTDEEKRCYYCLGCELHRSPWYLCWSCWMAYVKQQVEQVLPPDDNSLTL